MEVKIMNMDCRMSNSTPAVPLPGEGANKLLPLRRRRSGG